MLDVIKYMPDFMTSKGNYRYIMADIVIDNNRYRIKKIFQGLNWNPKLRSPLTEPGVNVGEGDCILEVNGKDSDWPATAQWIRFLR